MCLYIHYKNYCWYNFAFIQSLDYFAIACIDLTQNETVPDDKTATVDVKNLVDLADPSIDNGCYGYRTLICIGTRILSVVGLFFKTQVNVIRQNMLYLTFD